MTKDVSSSIPREFRLAYGPDIPSRHRKAAHQAKGRPSHCDYCLLDLKIYFEAF